MIPVLQIALPIAAAGAVVGALISIGLHWGRSQSWTERGILVVEDLLLGGAFLFIMLLSFWLWLELLTAGVSLLPSTSYAYLAVHIVYAGALTPVLRRLNRGQEEKQLSIPTAFFI
ncbi:MAG: hypothetical protein ABEL97_13970, partial [Salinibacter sp.]